ncbi:hypothetical protein Tco_1431034 [Tanacetum coccineum]
MTTPALPNITLASPDYSLASDTESNPSEDPSSDHIPPLPAISLFLSSDDDTTDSDTPDTSPSPTHGTPFTEITAFTQRSPIIPRRRVMILASDSLFLTVDLTGYHLNGPLHMLTARKRVRLLPTHRLAVRHFVDHSSSDYFSLNDSARYSFQILHQMASQDLHSDASSDSSSSGIFMACFIFDYLSGVEGIDVGGCSETVALREIRRITEKVIEGVQREARALDCWGGFGVTALIERIAKKMPNTRSGASMTQEEVEELVARRVAEEIEAREAAMNLEPLNESGDEQEGVLGRGRKWNGNGGRNGNGNRNGNHGMNYRGFMPVARECTFQDFLKCKPHNFSGTEGVDNALTWVDSHKRKIGVDAAYAMKWAGLIKLMTEVMVPDVEDRVERFIRGLPKKNQRNVIAANPDGLQDAICIANQLIDKKLQGYAARSAENKRRIEREDHAGTLTHSTTSVRYHHVRAMYCEVKINGNRVGHSGDYRSGAAVPNTKLGIWEPSWETRLGIRRVTTKLRQEHVPSVEEEQTLILTSSQCFACCLPHPTLDKVMRFVVRTSEMNIIHRRIDDVNGRSKSKLNIISCMKTQKYIEKGCQVYLAQVMSKKDEDKSRREADLRACRSYGIFRSSFLMSFSWSTTLPGKLNFKSIVPGVGTEKLRVLVVSASILALPEESGELLWYTAHALAQRVGCSRSIDAEGECLPEEVEGALFVQHQVHCVH